MVLVSKKMLSYDCYEFNLAACIMLIVQKLHYSLPHKNLKNHLEKQNPSELSSHKGFERYASYHF